MTDTGAFSENESESIKREVTHTWRVWKTVHEMCRDRGYDIAETEIQISLKDFRDQYSEVSGRPDRTRLKFTARPSEGMNKLHMTLPTRDNPNTETEAGSVWVEFLSSHTFGTKETRRFIDFCSANHYKSGILISHLPISAAARKMISAAMSFTSVEVFLEEDLLVNITHHTLVPKHILLSREEKVALLKRYRLKETQLPRILVRDPVAAYLGLKKGQVVKIIRDSETAGRYASYRICV